jgi:hypothetical protein
VPIAAAAPANVSARGPVSSYGYRSEAAFSRAFKRVTGMSPGAARRAGRAASDVTATAAQSDPRFR